jgi:hypothetical protein
MGRIAPKSSRRLSDYTAPVETQPWHFGLSPAVKVLDLKGRLRCRWRGRKGRAVVSIKWRLPGV